MYFPYLRGRQFELIALKELLENNLIGDRVVPIVEPVKLTRTFTKTLEMYTKCGHELALVMNPDVGEFVAKLKEREKSDEDVKSILSSIKSDELIQAYLIKKKISTKLKNRNDYQNLMIINTNRDCMDNYLSLFDTKSPKFTLIPDDRSFSRKVKSPKVLLEDHFKRARKNADYINDIDHVFSEDHIYYKEDGYIGFSDYTIVGEEYAETGFAPTAVAIHIVYFGKNKELRIRHFVSDNNKDYRNPAGKFGEALEKLVEWVDKNEIKRTKGLECFIDCYNEKRYPGLGTVKKYSIMHHIEIMNSYLEEES